MHRRPAGRRPVLRDGITRAKRIARLEPGTPIRVEVAGDLPWLVGHYSKVRDILP
jgi:hypothetical protein